MSTMTLPGLMDRTTALRPPATAQKLIVDIFAGAGGASMGIEKGLGRPIDRCVNHSPFAVEMHRINHPHSRHYCQNVWEISPQEVTGGQPVGLLWASPDCTHHSRAKGGKPLQKRIRCLAWVVIKWAREARPDVIILENVPEFQDWGPLDQSHRPIKDRKGETFGRWVASLRAAGYQVEWRELCAADYGVPTIRTRFFLVARRDGLPIVWPGRTHAPRHRAAALGLQKWRPASECIDWSLPCHSVFLSREEGRKVGVKRPLVEATMRRLALGLRKFVLEAAEPFVVCCNHAGDSFRGQGLGEPLNTITASRDALGLVSPVLSKYHGLRPGDRDGRCQDLREPLRTQDTSNRFALAAAYLMKTYGTCRHGQDEREPMPAITAGGNHLWHVKAFFVKYFGTAIGADCCDPLHTITGKMRFGLVEVLGDHWQIVDILMRMLTPRELLRAQFGEYAEEYVLIGTQEQQVAAIGNSVPPKLAEVLVRANCREALCAA